MKLCRHFYGARRNIFLDYDFLHTVNERDELRVTFTRFRGLEQDVAETIIPACEIWNTQGFSEEELIELQEFLQINMANILAEAENTRGGDANLVEDTFEIAWSTWVEFSLACYLSGESPEEGMNRALREYLAEFKADNEPELLQ